MKQLEKDNQKFPHWSYEEDLLLMRLVKSISGEIEWQNISKIINKTFHQKHSIRKSQQTRRRWERVIQVVYQRPWNRSEAQKFVLLSQQYIHSSRRFWNRLKKEFQQYTYKMLNHKLSQLKSMSHAQFILGHSNNTAQKVPLVSDPLTKLCKYLGDMEERQIKIEQQV